MSTTERKWVDPKIMVGGTAEGKNYFRRKLIEDKLWREIRKGNHINFSAPRRVGKSSIMKYLAKNPESGFLCCYENISSDNSAHDFYKRLFDLVMSQIKEPRKQRLREWVKAIGIEEISLYGSVKFSSKISDYKEKLLTLLGHLKDEEVQVVLFLDEFPDVLRNIADNPAEGKTIAKDILQTLRSIRHDDRFKGSFTLVLAGSIGLNHIVKDIDRLAVINDLYEQNLPALLNEAKAGITEAEEFIIYLVEGATMQIDENCRAYLLQELGQPLPYYIQRLLDSSFAPQNYAV